VVVKVVKLKVCAPMVLMMSPSVLAFSTRIDSLNLNRGFQWSSRKQNRHMTMRLNPESFEGSDMTITEYPNPVLRTRGADITEFDDKLRQTCTEMFSIMYQAIGVGLAAPQVDLSLRMFVYNPSGDAKLKMLEKVVCNPTILEYSTATDVEDEGCLSSRSDCCDGKVCRAKELMVEYQDERGKTVKRRIRGFEARVFQHEYDHIEGVLHLDRFSDDDRTRIQPELDIMVAQYKGDDGILEITPEVRKALKPPVRSGRMPPMEEGPAVEPASEKSAAPKMGFGGGNKMAKRPAPKKKKR